MLLDEAEKEKNEKMLVLYGVEKENFVGVFETEKLEEGCYQWRRKKSAGIRVRKFKESCGKRLEEMKKDHEEMELLGTAHLHRDFGPDSDEASDEDINTFSNLGLGLFHLVHHTNDMEPHNARIYAAWCEKRGSKRYVPNLTEVKDVKIYSIYTS